MGFEYDKEDVVSDALKRYGWSVSDDMKETGIPTEKSQVTHDSIKGIIREELLAKSSNPVGVVASVGEKAFEGIKDYVKEEKAKKDAQKRMTDAEDSNKKESSFLLKLAACICIISFLFLFPLLFFNTSNEEDAALSIVAAAQLELEETDSNVGGYKYKDWYGINGNWCAMFVSYCADQCGYIDTSIMPKTASVKNMSEWYKQNDLWVSKESGYEPKPGDIIFFQEGMSHVGIVVRYDADTKTIYTIEGNTGKSNTNPYHEGSHVKEQHYPLTYKRISGYGLPNYENFENKKPIKEVEEIK